MNIIYNSENYYVVEYPAQHGYELVDKHAARSTFYQGDVAEKFLESMQIAVNEDASVEHVDEFLDSYDVLMSTPLTMH
jgi:gamma-glutamyltranspeptidase